MTEVGIIKIKPSGKRAADTAVLRDKIYRAVRKKIDFRGEFKRTPFGKPYAEGCSVRFNISHSGNIAAAAVSGGEVGVDIERIRTVNLKIADKFCADEKDYILSAENKEKAFFEIWTAKEAYLKRSGTGITVPLDSFSVIGRDDIYRFFYEDCIISVCSEETPQFCGLSQGED